VERGNVNAYDLINLKFHEIIYHGTHNAAIADQAIKLRARMAGYRRTQLFEAGRPVRSRHEHDGILEAIMEGEGDTAARRMRAHMLNASFALESYIDKTASPDAG
jgi:DNA-binding GntR family transcriptional regulator